MKRLPESQERSRRRREQRKARRSFRDGFVVASAISAMIASAGVSAIEFEAPAKAETVHRIEVPMKSDFQVEWKSVADDEVERIRYDVPLADELQDVVFQESEKWDVPPALILAMMDQESDYRTDIVSSTGDYGIMQINEINHPRLQEELGVTDFLDPEQSIACGAYMIGELLDKYDGDLHHALTAYNRGEGGAKKYYSQTGTYETSYSRSIVDTYQALEKEVMEDAS